MSVGTYGSGGRRLLSITTAGGDVLQRGLEETVEEYVQALEDTPTSVEEHFVAPPAK